MKRKYMKPEMLKQSMDHKSSVVRTCSDADGYWWPMTMGNGVVIFVPELSCDMTEHEFMDEYGDNNGACYYASTSDGVTFHS